MNISISKKTLIFFTIVMVFAAAAFGIVVTSSIQGTDGVIRGCYKKNNGQLRVVESDAVCGPSEEALSWGGPPTVAGFVPPNADIGNQKGFTVTKLGTGHYKLVFPYSKFSDFPAIAASGWGIPGQVPTVNVFYNISNAEGFVSEIWVVAPDGVTPVEAGFQFVATQIVQ